MTESLRRRFVLIAMCALSATLVCLIAGINLSYNWRIDRRAEALMDVLYRNDGQMPAKFDTDALFQPTEETPFETRYFVVELARDGTLSEVDLEHIAAFDHGSAADCIAEIIETGKEAGYYGRYRYAVHENDDGSRTVLVLDCSQQLQGSRTLLRITCAAAGACWVTVLLLLLLFSRTAVRPFAENLARQKRFITDASHELKTPLAVISANAEVIALESGETEWVGSIRGQTARMTQLIQSMIELARTEEEPDTHLFQPFALSETVEEAVVPFETLITAQGKRLETEIEPGLTLRGAEDAIGRLVSILLDNAVKYTDPGGCIRLTLHRQGRGVNLTVQNTCAAFDPARLPYLFDRFYRADDSRARHTGGYGIGLSIAQGVARQHKGRLTARYQKPDISFTLTL